MVLSAPAASAQAAAIARHALWSPQSPQSLKPRRANIYVDKQYILAAMGLLSEAVYRNPASPLRNLRQALHWAWRYAVAQRLLASAERGWRRWLFALVWYLRR